MTDLPFQAYYPPELSYCYGCGKLNEKGLHIQSFWAGDEAICRYTPRPEHIAIPGFVYGGLIASLIDCHATGTAAAAAYRHEARPMDSLPANRFVTAMLHVDFLQPTPLGVELELRARTTEIKTRPDASGVARVRKVSLEVELRANDQLCACGQVVTIQAAEHMVPPPA